MQYCFNKIMLNYRIHTGRFWAMSIASFRERLLDFRFCRIVSIHVLQGCPGGLLQLSKGLLLRSSWHMFRLAFRHCGWTFLHGQKLCLIITNFYHCVRKQHSWYETVNAVAVTNKYVVSHTIAINGYCWTTLLILAISTSKLFCHTSMMGPVELVEVGILSCTPVVVVVTLNSPHWQKSTYKMWHTYHTYIFTT